MKSIKGEGLRFLIAGGLNTLLTYLIYLAILPFTAYWMAFSISFAAGVFIAYALNAGFVFRTPFSVAKMAKFPALYVVQYLAGLLLLRVLVGSLGIDERIAPLINVALLTPLTFMINRWFLVQRGNDGAA